MLDFKKIGKFAQDLHESIPKTIQDFTYTLDTKIHKILHNKIKKMHFISREELDLQSQILLKIQNKLKQIEKKLEKLEEKNKNIPPAHHKNNNKSK